MKTPFVAFTALMSVTAGPVLAASIDNRDAEATKVVVTENGERRELDIAPGSVTTVCEEACFVTFADGDMMPVKANDMVVIQGGKVDVAK